MAEAGPLDMVFRVLKELLVTGPADGSLQEWPGGPESVWRCEDVPLAEYIDCLHAVEAGPAGAEGVRVMVQGLRRLYFSFYTFGEHSPCDADTDTEIRSAKLVCALLDTLTMPVMNYADPPLTTSHLTQS